MKRRPRWASGTEAEKAAGRESRQTTQFVSSVSGDAYGVERGDMYVVKDGDLYVWTYRGDPPYRVGPAAPKIVAVEGDGS